ncbi:transglutaminase-like putative cysteine protease [Haloferula luteola]|uniref:Transglutaminase-like putative cysteine protease n=1 Tax=Haloferula luteola TaxID=595692 RepID=A0A840VBP0_9BACT|nr:transglutaminase family protein [Haloferula luteola]MBB5352964.1 transglutaminase-like putative cysteine protease [Haloferula luteola]
MPFQIQVELIYQVLQPSTVLLSLHALSTPNQQLIQETFSVNEGVRCEIFPLEIGQNRYVRVATGDQEELKLVYEVEVETHPDSQRIRDIRDVPVGHLPRVALPYLFPSRYCESDRLYRLAGQLFGKIDHPLAQAQAISDWIFQNVSYVPGISNASTGACETLVERAGVCRDFAHLGIALCRALSIPARYFTGYACGMKPQDFHACFEVCVGGDWFVFDPTRLAAPNGLVRIASGRDAADASLATIFGAMNLTSMKVSCESSDFQPLHREDLQGRAVNLEP